MKVVFNHQGHTIEVNREVLSMKLIIDDIIVDEQKGALKNQIKNTKLSGEVANCDGRVDFYSVAIKIGLVADEATLYFGEQQVETKTLF